MFSWKWSYLPVVVSSRGAVIETEEEYSYSRSDGQVYPMEKRGFKVWETGYFRSLDESCGFEGTARHFLSFVN